MFPKKSNPASAPPVCKGKDCRGPQRRAILHNPTTTTTAHPHFLLSVFKIGVILGTFMATVKINAIY